MIIKGRVIKVGDNINTDQIIPAKYLTIIDEKQLGRHCLEGLSKDFPQRIKEGDILVAGKNFGCGSSREHAVLALKGAGIKCVISESFSLIFFRNSINNALAVVELQNTRGINDGDELVIDFNDGEVRDISKGVTYKFSPYPEFIKRVFECGGLINCLKI